MALRGDQQYGVKQGIASVIREKVASNRPGAPGVSVGQSVFRLELLVGKVRWAGFTELERGNQMLGRHE